MKTAILLLNFGGPREVAEVQDFLYEILRDPNTIQLPIPQFLQNKLAKRIAARRTVEVARQYQEIGGKSPLVEATEKQRTALVTALKHKNITYPVHVAHRYLSEDAAKTVKQMCLDGVQKLLLLPLYPHFSYATTGTSCEQIQLELNKNGFSGQIEVIRSYPAQSGYIQALVEGIQQTLTQHQLTPEGTLILCSAHGLPKAYVLNGDTYYVEIMTTMNEIRAQMPDWKIDLSFQSRVGPAQWLQPYTDKFIPTLASMGIKNVVILGISFVNDHLETLYEIQHTYFEMAKQNGLTPFRVAAIEDHPAFVTGLAELVQSWSQGRSGMNIEYVLPPSQQGARVDRWIFFGWLILFITSLWFASC